jgi:hypothetical protein
VHTTDLSFDKDEPIVYCPIVEIEKKRRQNSSDHKAYMDTVYNNTIYNIAMALNADPSNFSSLDAISYLDSMWSYYFNQ